MSRRQLEFSAVVDVMDYTTCSEDDLQKAIGENDRCTHALPDVTLHISKCD